MPFVILPTNSASGGYDITNSLRFNEASDDKLTRNITGVNTTQLTLSFWTKRASGASSDNCVLFTSENNSGQYLFIDFGTPYMGVQIGGTSNRRTTNRVFRDPSAWYHIVITFDTTQATASDRIKIYINGVQETSFSTSTTGMSQNSNLPTISSTLNYAIGDYYGQTGFGYDGYLAEFYAIYGQALTPSSFGETDFDTGIWKPKAYTGTYGTNGFYLQFKNSASLGTDSSGNGNTFTVNNLTSVDQSTDTPTNNFCTLNALSKASDITLSNGNLTATRSTTSFSSVMSTIGVNKGKWYWEAKVVSLGIINFGVTKTTQDGTTHSSVDAGRVMYSSNGTIYDEGFANSPIATGTTFSTNDIIGLGLDCDNGTLRFYKNGTLIYTYSNAGLSTNEVTPANGLYNAVGDMNFGSPPYSGSSNTDGAGYGNFSYAVPSGYYALNTKNLANFG